MAYAKKCQYCKTTQIIWDEHLEGPNKFKEVQTNQPHTRDRCDAAKGQQTNFIPDTGQHERNVLAPEQTMGYRPTQKSETQQTSDFQLAQLITKVDNLIIGINKIMSAVSITHDMVVQLKDISLDADDISRLRTEVAELRQLAAKREDNFVPANQVRISGDNQTTELSAEHVKDMVKKGEQADEEELDLL